jgi:hypothetical protein
MEQHSLSNPSPVSPPTSASNEERTKQPEQSNNSSNAQSRHVPSQLEGESQTIYPYNIALDSTLPDEACTLASESSLDIVSKGRNGDEPTVASRLLQHSTGTGLGITASEQINESLFKTPSQLLGHQDGQSDTSLTHGLRLMSPVAEINTPSKAMFDVIQSSSDEGQSKVTQNPKAKRAESGLEDSPLTSPLHGEIGKQSERRSRATSTGRFTLTPRTIDHRGSPIQTQGIWKGSVSNHSSRPAALRTVSTPPSLRRRNSAKKSMILDQLDPNITIHARLKVNNANDTPFVDRPSKSHRRNDPLPSPRNAPTSLPPLSLSTYLQLELSSSGTARKGVTNDSPYESSAATFERMSNFLLLPPQLERVLLFGALACLDAWLYTFTILPLRFCKAVGILLEWWYFAFISEVRDLGHFVYLGIGRVWKRRNAKLESLADPPSRRKNRSRNGSIDNKNTSLAPLGTPNLDAVNKKLKSYRRRHRGASVPSTLTPNHKADILQGLVIVCSCLLLLRFDASRMYHSIRGQAAIKLYVIYNVLEVADRLFSALGQDISDCLFSKETLERGAGGRSKLLRPFGMFWLALAYNVAHATALFYQVITLNVAVNSYSNALLTLLLSNQFVEIKSTVFKKFEKENLFQLTCADVVERFQLWLMLLIIASRNLVEVGITGMSGSGGSPVATTQSSFGFGGSILPASFFLLPRWAGQVLTPFFFVLGSEMLVDWLKHAYITKFNSVRPSIYAKFYDVLAKDYFNDAFTDHHLVRRLGMPVMPLSCLFIRASMQTYHMFLATHVSPVTAQTASISVSSLPTTETTAAALKKFDTVFRTALRRSAFGGGDGSMDASGWDDAAALLVMIIVFLSAFLILLALKLVLGMCLLSMARRRYKKMKEHDKTNDDVPGPRKGGLTLMDVDESGRKWIYHDHPEELEGLKKKELAARDKEAKGDLNLSHVTRYKMSAKRIW